MGYGASAPQEFSRAVGAGERVELRTPVREGGYQPHAGAVFGLDCSPFQVDRKSSSCSATPFDLNGRLRGPGYAVCLAPLPHPLSHNVHRADTSSASPRSRSGSCS